MNIKEPECHKIQKDSKLSGENINARSLHAVGVFHICKKVQKHYIMKR